MESNELLAFGPFRLDTRARLLLRDGAAVPLPPKSYDALLYLVRNRGRAVSRDELARQVWPDVVVGDGSLSQTVFVLRKALGESEEGPRFVETVPRVGYRFTGEVEEISPRVRWITPRTVLAAALLVAVAALAGLALVSRRSTARRSRDRAGRLVSVVRDLPVAPDATHLLGHVEGSSVLAAPTAYYLVPDDGTPATRIPLRDGETPIAMLDDALAIATGDALRFRGAVKQDERPAARLPPLPRAGAAKSWAISSDGRFLARRLDTTLQILERRGDRFESVAELPRSYRDGERLALGPRSLALARGGDDPVRLFSLPDGVQRMEASAAEFGVTALAVDDGGTRVAIGGHFDEIDVYTVGAGAVPPLRIPRHGWTHGLAFVEDAPTLVASGYDGLAAFRGGAAVAEEPGAAVAGEDVRTFPGGLLVFSSDRHRLSLASYGGAPPARRVELKSSVVWALEHDASGKTLYAAGRDGRLYSVDVASSRVTSAAAHADGVPALLRDGDLLASSSDDKTIAVWRLPRATLERRQPAHRYLVNDLALAEKAPGGPALVSSSSDGELKTWTWPGLEPREAIDAAALTGRRSELHAVWAAADLSRLLAGTWDGALLDVRRTPSGASARRIEVREGVVYKLAGLPAVGLVGGVGHDPAGVFVFDLASGAAVELDTAGLDAFWCLAEPAGDALLVVGNGGLSRYAFRRDGRRLRYTLTARRQGGLELTAATLLPDGSVWGGTADGALVRFAPELLRAPSGEERETALPEPRAASPAPSP